MMNKQKVFTALGVILSFVIAVGGWALTSRLIDIKSDALLSSTGVTWINAPNQKSSATSNPVDTQNDSTPSEGQPVVTELDMVAILRNWESPGREKPHEPTAQQISMGQAIEDGEAALASYGSRGFIPIDLFFIDRTKTVAYLSQNVLPGQDGQILAPIYSYWTVALTGEAISVTMIINAVTGEVWNIKVQINPNQHTDISFLLGIGDAEKMLSEFLGDIGISSNATMNVDSDPSSSPPAITVFQEFDSGVYAVASIKGRLMPAEADSDQAGIDKTGLAPIEINIYLSSQTFKIKEI